MNPRVLGLILLGASAGFAIAGVVVAWNAVQRWRAVSAIEEYHLARLGNRLPVAGEAARAAARHLPGDAATALPAIDPAQAGAVEALERLRRQVHPRQREVVATGLAFAGVLTGSSVEAEPAAADAPYIRHLAALAKGQLPPFPEAKTGEAPQPAIISQTAQRHVAAAWKAGDKDALVSGLGAFVLCEPRHPEHAFARALLAALNPGASPEAKAMTTNIVRNLGADTAKVVRRAVQLGAPEPGELLKLIPQDQRTPDETQRVLAAGGDGASLEQLVQQAIKQQAAPALTVVFRRCLDADKLDLAREIVERSPEPPKQSLGIALAQHIGDVQTLARLQPDRADLRLTSTRPVGRSGMIAFHLGTRTGLVPRVGELKVSVAGQPLPPDRIRRWGSLVVLKIAETTGAPEIDVRLGDTVVFAGAVSL